MTAVHEAQQNVLAQRASRGVVMSNGTLFAVADAIDGLAKARAELLLRAVKRALITKPPADFSDETKFALLNHLMSDVGRFYNHGHLKVNHTAEVISYIDGLPPNLNERCEKFRPRMSGELDVILGDLAQEAGVSRRFLEVEIARRRLTAVRLSSRVLRVRQADWQRYLEQNSTARPTE